MNEIIKQYCWCVLVAVGDVDTLGKVCGSIISTYVT